MSPVTHHTSFMHGIHMGSRGGVKLHPCEKSIGQPRRNILCWGSCNLGQNKMKQRTPIPAKSRMKLHKRQNAPFSHPWFRGGGGGKGYKFPIYFVQDCSLCNALIENKTRIALMAFSKKSVRAMGSRAMDEKKYCNVNRIKAISKLSASLTNRLW